MPRLLLLAALLLAACATEHDAGPELNVEDHTGAGASQAQAGSAQAGSGQAGQGGSDAGAAGESQAGGSQAGQGGGGSGGSAGDSGSAGSGAGSGGSGAGQGGSGAGQAGSSAGASGSGAGQGGSGGAGSGGKGGSAGSGGKGGSGGSAQAGQGGKGGSAQAGSGGSAQAGSGGGGAGGGGGSGGGEGCPPEMVYVADGGTCVDRWEAQVEVDDGGVWKLHSPYETLDGESRPLRAVSSEGVVPQGYISGAQAREACLGAGKRLCGRQEYRRACEGPAKTTYPYGNTHVDGACNEGRSEHPIVQLFGSGPDAFSSEHMNDPAVNQLPDSLATTGSHPQCESGYGAFDMVGNLHEWVDEDDGTFCGGYYVDAEINGSGCLYTTTAHSFTYHDYSTGFRCCKTP